MQRTVLITAGGSGIGYAMAHAFADDGADVVVTDTDAGALDDIKHPSISGYHADVTNEEQMTALFDWLRHRWDRLDIVHANAGIAGATAPIEEISLAEWSTCLEVNLTGSFLTCRTASQWMKEHSKGVITLTSSTAGLFGYPLRSAYAAAKWGIIGLTKTLAMELGPFGIRVNAICPGAVSGDRMDRVITKEAKVRGIDTDSLYQGYADCVSLRQFVSAEDVADMALFLASEKARSISGMAMAVDGHTEKVTL